MIVYTVNVRGFAKIIPQLFAQAIVEIISQTHNSCKLSITKADELEAFSTALVFAKNGEEVKLNGESVFFEHSGLNVSFYWGNPRNGYCEFNLEELLSQVNPEKYISYRKQLEKAMVHLS